MAGSLTVDTLQADSTSTLVLKNGVANTPPTIQDSAGTQIGTFCRAWVNFNGTTVTNPASMTGVRGSFNISSILDNGTGDYTINFATAMPDANYCAVFGIANGTSGTAQIQPLNGGTYSTTALRVAAYRTESGNNVDMAICNVAIFR